MFELFWFWQHDVVSKNRDLKKNFIKKLLRNWTKDVHYMFFPINHKHSAKEAGFHWTLLVLDCHT